MYVFVLAAIENREIYIVKEIYTKYILNNIKLNPHVK